MIKQITNTFEKERAIQKCDSAFPIGICSRDDYDKIFKKIDTYADFIVAYEDGEIAGYAAIYNNDLESRTAYITMIGVLESFQRRHIGNSLITACKEMATMKGMNAIRLEVISTNAKAISFYEKNGFVFEKACSDSSFYMIFFLHESTN